MMTQMAIIRTPMWLITCAIVCPCLMQLNAQNAGQLRDDLNRDAQLQALQQAWDLPLRVR